METFRVTRDDDCIYIKDLRDEQQAKHITPGQAKELKQKLGAVLEKPELKPKFPKPFTGGKPTK